MWGAGGHSPNFSARMRLAIDSARGYLEQTLVRLEKGSPDAMLFVLGSKAAAAEMALTVTDLGSPQ